MSNSVSVSGDTFAQFDLHPSLERGIREAGFEKPRPIQRAAMPHALDGLDVLGLAETGTGKTAAFALPLLDQLLDEPVRGVRALVLAPTRELASQIAEEIRVLARFTKIRAVTVFGGVSQHRQVTALRDKPEIVVGCPGRVLDLHQQGLLDLRGVETLVLDEADHMFDMGFLPTIRKILAALPKDRQNLLFSATMPPEVRRLADDVLKKPTVVELTRSAPAQSIDHALYPVREEDKNALLEHMLKQPDCTSAIVFTRTKHRARRLSQQLEKRGHRAVALQGNMSQNARERAMEGFRKRAYDILVATDIVARGIDVTAVSHVINYDVPTTPEAYTHRIGRTGRGDLEGVACTFVTRDDQGWVRATERMIGKPIPRRNVEGFEAIASSLAAPDRSLDRNRSPERRAAPPRGRTASGPQGNSPSANRQSGQPGARSRRRRPQQRARQLAG